MAALGRLVQRTILQHHRPAICITSRGVSEWEKYSRQDGVPLKVHRILQQDYDVSLTGLIRFLEKRVKDDFEESERFVPERHKILGPDLATAHFVVARDGAVKFVGRDAWFKKDSQGNYFLPNRHISGMYIEAIDCSNTSITYTGLDNFINLDHLRYINFSNCENVNDWVLNRMHQFSNTLEFLDISGCKNVTERGLACLYILKNLDGLKLSTMNHVEDLQLVVIMLQELLPNCVMLGVDEPPSVETLQKHKVETDISDGAKKTICANSE